VIDLTVDGSPDGCRAAAREIAVLAEATGVAGGDLARVRERAADHWQGEAASAFGARASEVGEDAERLADLLRFLTVALEALARRLDQVAARLADARSRVGAAGIPCPPGGIPAVPDPAWDDAQRAAHLHAVVLVRAARDDERWAQEAWLRALGSVTEAHRRVLPPAAPQQPSLLDRLGDAVSVRPLPDLLPGLGEVHDRLPDLPDLPDLDLPGIDMPDLDDLRVLRQAVEAAPVLVSAGVRALAGRAATLAREAGSELVRAAPDLARRAVDSIDDLPTVPTSGRALIGMGVSEGIEQYEDDLARDDLTQHERIGRAAFVGGATVGGATGGMALCSELGVTSPLVPLCGAAGGWAGEHLSEAVLGAIDAR